MVNIPNRKIKKSEFVRAAVFLLPFMILSFTFLVIPFIETAIVSFWND